MCLQVWKDIESLKLKTSLWFVRIESSSSCNFVSLWLSLRVVNFFSSISPAFRRWYSIPLWYYLLGDELLSFICVFVCLFLFFFSSISITIRYQYLRTPYSFNDICGLYILWHLLSTTKIFIKKKKHPLWLLGVVRRSPIWPKGWLDHLLHFFILYLFLL